MSTTRRGFIGSLLAIGAAPAIARAESLMPLWIHRPILWADGINDDAPALQALIDGNPVIDRKGVSSASKGGLTIRHATLVLADRPLVIPASMTTTRFDNCTFVGMGSGAGIVIKYVTNRSQHERR